MSDIKDIIGRIRKSILTLAQEDANRFHSKDLDSLKSNDWPIERYVLTNKTEDVALRALIKSMEWRKEFGVNEFSDQHFPEEVYRVGLIHTAFNDRDNRPILWTKLSAFRKSELSPIIKQFLVHNYEKLDRITSNQGWAYIGDSTGAGLSNVDMDLSKFMVDVLQNHYPRGPKYIAAVELPWILNAAAKVIMTFMNPELKSCIKFISKDELKQFVDTQNIPVHLNGSNDQNFIKVPEGVKPLEQLKYFNLTAEQIEKIKSIFKFN